MKKVIVASENPVKIKVAEKTFLAVFPDEKFEFIGIKSDSGVPEQPIGEETKLGASNRLKFIMERHPDADFWISQEGGIFEDGDKFFNRAWIMVCDKDGFIGESSTTHIHLPKDITKHIKEGLELGHALDKFFGVVNSKHGNGLSGYVTDGIFNRSDYYTQAGIVALSMVKHKDWYK